EQVPYIGAAIGDARHLGPAQLDVRRGAGDVIGGDRAAGERLVEEGGDVGCGHGAVCRQRGGLLDAEITWGPGPADDDRVGQVGGGQGDVAVRCIDILDGQIGEVTQRGLQVREGCDLAVTGAEGDGLYRIAANLDRQRLVGADRALGQQIDRRE